MEVLLWDDQQHLTQMGMKSPGSFHVSSALCVTSCGREVPIPLFPDFSGRDRPFILKQKFLVSDAANERG